MISECYHRKNCLELLLIGEAGANTVLMRPTLLFTAYTGLFSDISPADSSQKMPYW